MRIANSAGRLVLIDPDAPRALDVEQASDGRFSADPQAVYHHWSQFRAWAADATFDQAEPSDIEALEAVTPRPRQVFAIGLNYRDHAEETHFEPPSEVVVFTKYVSSLTGPRGEIALSGTRVDWEAELVAVIGAEARHVSAAEGWDHVAGVTIGQDISDRTAQFQASPPQFSLSKSHPGYSPIGPWLVTTDELGDRDNLALGCDVNGREAQKSDTGQMIFPVGEIIARLSSTVTLLPGDLIFTGTPAGVGMGREPEWFLRDGDVLTTWIDGIGEMRHRFTGPA